jgi:hypothetical protein
LLRSVPNAKNLYGALGHTVNGDVGQWSKNKL